MYDDVKIELKKTNDSVDRMKYLAAKARLRTLQRIKRVQEEEEMRNLESTLIEEAQKAVATKTDPLAKARAAKAAKAAERAAASE